MTQHVAQSVARFNLPRHSPSFLTSDQDPIAHSLVVRFKASGIGDRQWALFASVGEDRETHRM